MSKKYRCISFVILICVFFSIAPSIVFSQDTQDKNIEKYLIPPDQEQGAKRTPVPYNPNEFESWTYFVYRFLAVSVGVFPIAVLVSSIGYDSYKTGIESQKTGRFEQRYLPLFFGGADKPQYNSDEVGTILLAATGISLVVGSIDLIIAIVKNAQGKSLENLFRDDKYGSKASKSTL